MNQDPKFSLKVVESGNGFQFCWQPFFSSTSALYPSIDTVTKMLLLSFLLFPVSVLARYQYYYVPIMFWGNYGLEETWAPVGYELRHEELEDLMQKLTSKKPHILLFYEEKLSIEDFCCENSTFPELNEISKTEKEFLYVDSAEFPVNVIERLNNSGYTIENIDKDLPPTLENATILAVNFKDIPENEKRQTFLRAHDEDIARISQEAIRRYGNVLVAYTGRLPSYITYFRRPRRDAEDEEPATLNEIIMTDSDKTIVVVTGSPIVLQKNNEVINLTQVIYASTETNKKPYIALDVKFKEEEISLDLVFNSPSENHAWTLETIKIENWEVELRSRIKITAPPSYSYFCAQDIVFTGTKEGIEYSLTLKGLQAQPRVSNNNFGPASDCIPYFSEPIWSGIMIMSLLIVVAMTAILMILDIHTNDKFDDPKGKVITITNAE